MPLQWKSIRSVFSAVTYKTAVMAVYFSQQVDIHNQYDVICRVVLDPFHLETQN